MNGIETFNRGQATHLSVTRMEAEETDTLFLESLVNEANRTLDSLKTVDYVMDEEQGEGRLCVAYRETKRPVSRLSLEEMSDLIIKVRQLQEMLLDGAKVA